MCGCRTAVCLFRSVPSSVCVLKIWFLTGHAFLNKAL